ncbi:MAG: PPC domain-containing protein [Deltaproteobacteria bacterium]|jgi:hypothetical protein|nr:PPC domain-containing protein [Deltaproteobacteria bacterium]
MTFKTALTTLGLAAALSLSLAPAAGAQTAFPAKPAQSENADAVSRLTMAAQLAEEGRRTGSPMALAAAAEIMNSTEVTDMGAVKTADAGGMARGASEPSAEAPAGPPADGTGDAPAAEAPALGSGAELFAEAAALARSASNEPLAVELEKSASSVGSRQPAAGHGGRHRDRVSPSTTDIYTVRYNANELARATVIAGGNYDLDLYVYDPAGTLVAYDNDSTSIGICAWTPQETGDYRLRVKNTTSNFVNYLIFTN